MINAGKYNKKIKILKVETNTDAQGFPETLDRLVLTCYASVKTTKGFTLIANDSDFEKVYTNFTIRYSEKVVEDYYDDVTENRSLIIEFNNKTYKIEYLNNVNEENLELEMQAKEVLK